MIPDWIGPGKIYEDCAFHPVLCTHVHEDDENTVSGISLIDGSSPRNCDIVRCDVIPLTIEQVIEIKRNFPRYVERRRKELGIDDAGPDGSQA